MTGPHPGYRCPSCDDWVPPGATFRPFCAERCKTTDLGHWLAGRYKIPVRDDDEDVLDLVLPQPPDLPPAEPADDGRTGDA